jgi:hypothetical protein
MYFTASDQQPLLGGWRYAHWGCQFGLVESGCLIQSIKKSSKNIPHPKIGFL